MTQLQGIPPNNDSVSGNPPINDSVTGNTPLSMMPLQGIPPNNDSVSLSMTLLQGISPDNHSPWYYIEYLVTLARHVMPGTGPVEKRLG